MRARDFLTEEKNKAPVVASSAFFAGAGHALGGQFHGFDFRFATERSVKFAAVAGARYQVPTARVSRPPDGGWWLTGSWWLAGVTAAGSQPTVASRIPTAGVDLWHHDTGARELCSWVELLFFFCGRIFFFCWKEETS